QFTANNPNVEVVRHAIALDERRAYFPQNLWGHDPRFSPDVEQVWFAGVHCDVGGGYPETEAGLSKIALRWMVAEAKKFGLKFRPKAGAAILPQADTSDNAAPNPAAKQHESLHGLWWIVEFLPKRIKDPAANFTTRWILRAGRPRYVAEQSKINTSVLERQKRVSYYRPRNLPTNYVV